MARSSNRAGDATDSRTNSADSRPLVDPLTYTDGEGFEAGNRAPSSKYRTVEGKIVDDLNGEQGWEVVVKGDRVTPAIAREVAEGQAGAPVLNSSAAQRDTGGSATEDLRDELHPDPSEPSAGVPTPPKG